MLDVMKAMGTAAIIIAVLMIAVQFIFVKYGL